MTPADVRAAEERIAEVLTNHPEAAERTAAFLEREPTMEELMAAQRFDKPTPLRLDQEILERADALIPSVGKRPEFQAIGRVTRASVLRLAILRGLAELEAEAKPRKKS